MYISLIKLLENEFPECEIKKLSSDYINIYTKGIVQQYVADLKKRGEHWIMSGKLKSYLLFYNKSKGFSFDKSNSC